jgi:hypothetical protein
LAESASRRNQGCNKTARTARFQRKERFGQLERMVEAAGVGLDRVCENRPILEIPQKNRAAQPARHAFQTPKSAPVAIRHSSLHRVRPVTLDWRLCRASQRRSSSTSHRRRTPRSHSSARSSGGVRTCIRGDSRAGIRGGPATCPSAPTSGCGASARSRASSVRSARIGAFFR